MPESNPSNQPVPLAPVEPQDAALNSAAAPLSATPPISRSIAPSGSPLPADSPSPAAAYTPSSGGKVLERMLDRLFASLVNGPGLNCRPNRSRQRVDLAQITALDDRSPAAALQELLGPQRTTALKARVTAPKKLGTALREIDEDHSTSDHMAAARSAASTSLPAAHFAAGSIDLANPVPGPSPADESSPPEAPATEKPATEKPPTEKFQSEKPQTEKPSIDSRAQKKWNDQNALLQKFHVIADDARTYEQDTGVHVLNVGFPLLSLPPAFAATGSSRQATRRILAPIAYIPVSLSLGRGAQRSVEIACRGEGIDLVRPNTALLAWLQRQTGKPAAELFADEKGENPWREIGELVRQVCGMVDLAVPAEFAQKPQTQDSGAPPLTAEAEAVNQALAGDQTIASSGQPPAAVRDEQASPPPALELRAASPTAESEGSAEILLSAVLGLFPMANQGLLRDMQELVADPSAINGPLQSFIRLGAFLDAPPAEIMPVPVAGLSMPAKPREFADERLVADADPCQARAVRLARQNPALVIHGPPGTGKSQTIANIIGDHLARGQRVLFVCEKRTALDVVANRLEHMGLGALVGVVHDPQRDQRELYKKIREQLEKLAEAIEHPRAAAQLGKIDTELQQLHTELSDYRSALTRIDPESAHSFHELMGQWLMASPKPAAGDGGSRKAGDGGEILAAAAASELAKTRLAALSPLEHPLQEMYLRALKVAFATNPWTPSVAITLAPLLARTIEQNQAALKAIVAAAQTVDETSREKVPAMPAFVPAIDLTSQGGSRLRLAENLNQLLKVTPPDVLDRWAGRALSAIRAARSKLTEAQPYLAAFAAQKPETELTARWLAAVKHDLPDAGTVAQQRAALDRYASAFATNLQWVDDIRGKAPKAAWPIVARWVGTETVAAAAVQKKLDAAAPLAERAAAGPLDPELLAQYRRQPFGIAQIIRWQSAIATYLPIAKSFLGFLQGAKKKAAAPAIEFFGLGLSFGSATRVGEFLSGLRARLEVWDVMTRTLVPQAVGASAELPDDPELLDPFFAHRAVLDAAADFHRPPLPEAAAAADPTALVNRMVAAEYVAAAPVLRALDLAATPQNAARAMAFLQAIIVRIVLQDLNEKVLNAPTPDDLMDDGDLDVSLRGHAALFDFAIATEAEPALRELWPAVAAALGQRDALPPMIVALKLLPKRAADILKLEKALGDAALFGPSWLADVDLRLRAGDAFGPAATALMDRLDTLEDVVRVRETLATLAATVRPAAAALLEQSAGPADAWDVLRREVLAGEIRRRLLADPQLQSVDGHRLATCFERYRQLEEKKRGLVRDVILDQWIHQQKERLLTATGGRLSAAGAELGRRLLLRGERAIRLRQVIARGRSIDGGDPLFDICPVWMVSPETAAQVFPREPIFDVVVFDEASQCRLEEALPVMTRGRRVVIAGDPKQLPPTRFFESAFSASEDGDEPDDDQGWFERQQGEVEDLLTAALGLEAQQSYLDVHYRSKNADLIAFSNENFYGSRLQPIPGHPSRRAELPPIQLHRVAGLYEKRVNEPEAAAVVALVQELLAQKNPPSIGIACFNLVQRDLIVEKLDELAADDAKFGKKLAEARERIGAGSFEGLFVKNLENVQGDERDDIIISTTYGPDAAGKFYRRFGPLAMPGGGRRLNVLVTRARQNVHLVTSIPAEAYRALPPAEEGQTPGGGWLLFSYLRGASELERHYAEREPLKPADEMPAPAQVRVGPTRAPSQFAESLARQLSGVRGAPADVYWGNDGFCVDVVLHAQPDAEDGTRGEALGVLCDAARFAPADDLMEWDVFRTGILEAQGWKLHRVWTPHFFRDADGQSATLLKAAAR